MSDRCPHAKGDTTMHCEQAEQFARERDEARAERDIFKRTLDKRDAEVERLRDSLSVTGDTRHEAMEAAIRVAEAHSETIRQLRDEAQRLRVQTQRVVDEWDAWLSEAAPEWVSPGMLEAVNALRGEGE